jgi:hypothetical protein
MKWVVVKWVIGSVVVIAILAAAHYVIQVNEAAMAGTSNTQPSGFYSH